mmetsp:Transcript_1461/g.3086  ORF Transcript_1461/g.3086 Transcript_1461/m.3086 type:complete len:306 (-) Transcript_1461:1083-2000(-)
MNLNTRRLDDDYAMASNTIVGLDEDGEEHRPNAAQHCSHTASIMKPTMAKLLAKLTDAREAGNWARVGRLLVRVAKRAKIEYRGSKADTGMGALLAKLARARRRGKSARVGTLLVRVHAAVSAAAVAPASEPARPATPPLSPALAPCLSPPVNAELPPNPLKREYEEVPLNSGGFKRRRVGTKWWQFMCKHGKERAKCKEGTKGGCGGASICEHNRQRSRCKECDGSEICQHRRHRSSCKECGGASICEHGRQRNYCKECGGASICEHMRQRSQCKECGGASICRHGRVCKPSRRCARCRVGHAC